MGLLWNGLGAGFILPLYYLLHLHNLPKDRRIPSSQSKSLLPAIIAGSYIPAAAMLSVPLIPRSTARHQNIISLVQVTPLLTTVIQHLMAATLGPIRTGRKPLKEGYLGTLRRSYMVIGTIAAAAHIYVVVRALQTTGLGAVYLPGPNSQVTAASLDKVAQGAFLFLQYDWIMVNVSTLIFSFSMITDIVDAGALSLMASLVVIDCIVGPGALLCAVLWLGENSRGGVSRRH